jgi:hypothetical protein
MKWKTRLLSFTVPWHRRCWPSPSAAPSLRRWARRRHGGAVPFRGRLRQLLQRRHHLLRHPLIFTACALLRLPLRRVQLGGEGQFIVGACADGVGRGVTWGVTGSRPHPVHVLGSLRALFGRHSGHTEDYPRSQRDDRVHLCSTMWPRSSWAFCTPVCCGREAYPRPPPCRRHQLARIVPGRPGDLGASSSPSSRP